MKVNVEEVYALVYDIDKVEPQVFLEAWRPEGFSYLLYTTFSCTEDLYSIRVVIPLSRPISLAEHAVVWPAVSEKHLGGVDDPSCRDASRMFYLPACKPGAYRLSIPGGNELLDPDRFLRGAVEPVVNIRYRDEDAHQFEPLPLAAARETLKNVKLEHRPKIYAMLEGRSWVDPGNQPNRNPSLWSIASVVAFECPGLSTEDFLALLRPSLQEVQKLGGKECPCGHGVYPCEQMAADMFSRAAEAKAIKYGYEKRMADEMLAGLEMAANVLGLNRVEDAPDVELGPDGRYSPEYLRRKEEELGYPEGVLGANGNAWLIRKCETVWVWKNGRYASPVKVSELADTVDRDFALAPLLRFYQDDKGVTKRVPANEYVRRWGAVARHYRPRLWLEKSWYDDSTETFYEAVCPVRGLEPEYNAQIDEWLTLLGGDQHETLKKWIAAVTLVDRQCCALVLEGKASAGKGLLSAGLAQLWPNRQPIQLTAILGQFNGALLQTPLVVSDEYIPEVNGRSRSRELRDLIGRSAHTLNVKYLPEAQLEGCIRLIITSNNQDVLSFRESLTPEDIEALALRFLHISVSSAPTEYLARNNGYKMTHDWVEGGSLIARHALWLRDQHTEVKDGRRILKGAGQRFLVEGTLSTLHKKLVLNNTLSSLVCEWIVGFMTDNAKRCAALAGNWILEPGELLLNSKLIVDGWANYIRSTPVPHTASVTKAIRHISLGNVERQVGSSRKTLTYHRINLDYVYEWSAQSQIGDVESMKRQVAMGELGEKTALRAIV